MLEELTWDQIFIMAASKDQLLKVGTQQMDVDELRQQGIIPKVKYGEARSLVQRIKQKKAEEAERNRRQSKRERRRQRERELIEARARGEI